MSGATSIEWTERSWNPVRGCSRVSRGCEKCYAERVAARFAGQGQPYEGLAKSTPSGPRWTGKVALVPEHLGDPLRWRKPCRVFVNSMSDLFHEALSNEDIAAVWGVMAACPKHTFQVLTKRAKRMREWFAWAERKGAEYSLCRDGLPNGLAACAFEAISGDWGDEIERDPFDYDAVPTVERFGANWPLRNVWLGVSVEDQRTADERIPELLETPAAIRWVSYEPAIAAVDFFRYLRGHAVAGHCVDIDGGWWHEPGKCEGARVNCDGRCCAPTLDWVVIGGESGPGARPFDLAWARSTIRQCREAGVAVFVKQLGANAREDGLLWPRSDRKGGDPAEWPEDLRVREYPGTGRGPA